VGGPGPHAARATRRSYAGRAVRFIAT
jgi:hypothetical protein